MIKIIPAIALIFVASCAPKQTQPAASLAPVVAQTLQPARNPIVLADVPDPSVIRVGNAYYMSSTTMHMNPGVPIMKSYDLVNWQIINYAYTVLEEGDRQKLQRDKNEYGRGSWASSLRYVDNTWYVSTFSHASRKTYIFSTRDIEQGPWRRATINKAYHDASLFFDEGRVYLVYGVNDITLVELGDDAENLKSGGMQRIIIPEASSILGSSTFVRAEGAHIQKIKGKYYISLIVWSNDGLRNQLLYRADSLTGPYEGRVILQDAGIARGGFVDTPLDEWYAFLVQGQGALGRSPVLVPVYWQNGWPVLGENGKVSQTLDFQVSKQSPKGIVSSDEFLYPNKKDIQLNRAWQWNHNPLEDYWSVTQRPGYLRLINDRVDDNIFSTRNTLSQRSFGPTCSAQVLVDVSNIKPGDITGLAAFQKRHGFVGVKRQGEINTLVVVNNSSGIPGLEQSIELLQKNVHLRIDMDFSAGRDKAYFFYSLDGLNWQSIGDALQMSYTEPHSMGYRFALFNYATQEAGGFVDFDYFRIGESLQSEPF